MSSTKITVVDERRELELREADNDDALTIKEGKPVVALVLGGIGVVLMVLSGLLPS